MCLYAFMQMLFNSPQGIDVSFVLDSVSLSSFRLVALS